jgi:mannose-6-phosphate isomerase-like protein (cupin superfamily)
MEATDLTDAVVALLRDGTSDVIATQGQPIRVDGFTVGVARLDRNPPHRGEMHPDGDELLYLISGRLDIVLEEGGTQEVVGAETVIPVGPGQAFLVPRGHWHRVEVRESSELLHVTPGPGDGHRPL